MTRRIAFFQAEWPVQVHTANLALLLARAGYGVDLFVYTPWNPNYVDLRTLAAEPGITVHDLSPAPPPPASHRDRRGFSRLARSLASRLPPVRSACRAVHYGLLATGRTAQEGWRLLRGSEVGLLPRGLADRARDLMGSQPYHCAIGVEKKGLLWAAAATRGTAIPVVYYSLELFGRDYARARARWSLEFRRLRAAERRRHRRAAATIVQDPDRARVLFEDNGLSLADASILYLPVSVIGPPRHEPSQLLRERFGLPAHTRIVLSFGLIHEDRYALDLARAAQRFPDDWVLVMHGLPDAGTLEKIRAIDRRGKVLLSLERVPAHRVADVIASADVGLAFYRPELANDRLTAFSSEKMALYMRCGVPFIAFDYAGYRRLADDEQCGVVIRNLDELPRAIRTILDARDRFARHARRTFEKYYDFTSNFAAVLQGIELLGAGASPDRGSPGRRAAGAR